MCNGLVWPDRTPHPAAFEVKQLQAPLSISLPSAVAAAAAGGLEGGQASPPEGEAQLLLRNKQHFSSTAGLTLSWRLLADGRPVAAGSGKGSSSGGWQRLELEQPVGPQQEAAVGLGVTWAELAGRAQHAVEAAVEVQAQVCRMLWPAACSCESGKVACLPLLLGLSLPPSQLSADSLWAPAGHEVQTVQLDVTGLLPAWRLRGGSQQQQVQQPAGGLQPRVQSDSNGITVSSAQDDSWSLRFDAAMAGLAGWTVGGKQLLAAPLTPCFYRAPTDNDKGGSGGSSYAAR